MWPSRCIGRYVYSILGGQLKHVQSFANPAIEPPAIKTTRGELDTGLAWGRDSLPTSSLETSLLQLVMSGGSCSDELAGWIFPSKYISLVYSVSCTL